MTTKTAARPFAEATKLPNTRQPQARKTRTKKTARLNQPATPHNPLRGLFSDEELRQIDERCRAMGRSAVDIVASALRDWVNGGTTEKGQSLEWMKEGITHKDRDQALAEFTANLGEEMGRWEDADCSRDLIFRIGYTFFAVREAAEIFQRRTWHRADTIRKSVGATEAAEFAEHLDNLNPRHVRRVYNVNTIEPQFAAEFWSERELPIPKIVREAVDWKRRYEFAERAKIAAEVRAEIMAETASVSPSQVAQLVRFDVLGKEIARVNNSDGALELIYENSPHHYIVFECIEVFADGAWRTWREVKNNSKRDLASFAPDEVRRSFYLESGLLHDDIADWFDANGIAYPATFSESLRAFRNRERLREADIAQRAVDTERKRIAQAMNLVLAA